MNIKKIGKAAVVGALGSLVMFILMTIAIQTGNAPFKIPPSAAFLVKLGLPVKPLALFVHFGYGAFWSVVLAFLFREDTGVMNGLLLAAGLWGFMMVVYSPIIGWGFFGFGGSDLAKDSKLYLEPGPKYLIATLVLHVVYGVVIGFGNSLWIDFAKEN